jgi:hypothetical protein
VTHFPYRHGQRVRITTISTWNGTPALPALARLVGRVGTIVAKPGKATSKVYGEATFTVDVEGFGEVRLKLEEIEPVRKA